MSDEGSRSEEARREMMRNIDAAQQLQQIKSNTSGNKTLKVRNHDMAMRPTLHPGDMLIIGAANVMKLRTNDLVYYRAGGDDYKVRRIARRINEGSDVAFVVVDDDGNESRMTDTQVLGLVLGVERRGETMTFQRPGIDGNKVMEKGLNLVQDAYNRISGLFNRKSGG